MNEENGYVVLLADKSEKRSTFIKNRLRKEGFAVDLFSQSSDILNEKLKARGRFHIVCIVIDQEDVIYPEQAELATELSNKLACHASKARRALLISGSLNPMSKELLALSTFYRIVPFRQDNNEVAAESVANIAQELRNLDTNSYKFLADIKKNRILREMLGTAVSLVDNHFRVWHMDTVHIGITGGSPVEGQLCWHGYRRSRFQKGACAGCAIAETLESRKASAPRKMASLIESNVRFFEVMSLPVYSDQHCMLIAEIAVEITDTPATNCMSGKELLTLLMQTITSRGFAHARSYESFDDKLKILAHSGYKISINMEKEPLNIRNDRYTLNTFEVAKKPQIYSEIDLGKEEFRKVLGKQNVKWWMEFPFFDASDQPVGLLAVDNEDETREKKIDQLLQIQQIADTVERITFRMFWLPRQEAAIKEKLDALHLIGYEQATIWDFFSNNVQMIKGRLSVGFGEDVRAVLTSLYRERFLYEVGALHRIPLIFDRLTVKEGSEVCKHYMTSAPQLLVFPLFVHGRRLVGFLSVSNPISGQALGPLDIGRIQPFADSLGPIIAQTQPFLAEFSKRALPILCKLDSSKCGDENKTKPCLVSIKMLIDRLLSATEASHIVVRILDGSQLKVLAQQGFSTSIPKVVNVTDEQAHCARALRLGFPDVQNNLANRVDFKAFCQSTMLSKESYEEFRTFTSMITVPISDATGLLGTIEVFSNTYRSHFSSLERQDWVNSVALRLATIIRRRNIGVGETQLGKVTGGKKN